MAWKKGLRKFYQTSSNFLSDNTVVLQHTHKPMHCEIKVLLSHWHTRANGCEFFWSLLLNPHFACFRLVLCAVHQHRAAEEGEHYWPLLQCTENSLLRGKIPFSDPPKRLKKWLKWVWHLALVKGRVVPIHFRVHPGLHLCGQYSFHVDGLVLVPGTLISSVAGFEREGLQ